MSNPKRILRVVSIMDPSGLETQIMNIFRSIDRKKYVYDFLVTTGKKGLYDNEIIQLGGEIHYLDLVNQKTPCGVLKQLNLFFEENAQKYEIIHSHLNSWSGIILYFAKKYNIKVRIAHSHTSSWGDRTPKTFMKYIISKLIPFVATDLWAVGEDAAKWLFPNNLNSVQLFPNSKIIDDFLFSISKRKKMRTFLEIDDSTYLVTHIGSFTEVKNHNFIINLAKEIKMRKNSAKQVKFLLVGKGPLFEKTLDKVRKEKLESFFIFYGVSDDVSSILSASDLLILPSLYEGLPNVAIEAQINGCPVFLSDEITQEVAILPKLVTYFPLEKEIWSKEIMKRYPREMVSCSDIPSTYKMSWHVSKIESFYEGVF